MTVLTRFKAWLSRVWPLMRRSTHLIARADLEMLYHNKEVELEHKYEEADRRHAEIVKDCFKAWFERRYQASPGTYRVAVEFNAYLGNYFGSLDRKDLEYIGRIVGRQIANEIASSRFIDSANATEARMSRPSRPLTFGSPEWRVRTEPYRTAGGE